MRRQPGHLLSRRPGVSWRQHVLVRPVGETPSKLTRKFLIFLCLIKSSTCLKSENEIKFANVSRDFDLFGKNVKYYFLIFFCSPVYARNA